MCNSAEGKTEAIVWVYVREVLIHHTHVYQEMSL